MNNKFALISILLVASCGFIGCEKDPDTSLRITVRDSTNQGEGRITGATVKLYANDQDMYYQMNQIGPTLTSGADASVLFTNLNPDITYSFRIEKGCRNNLFYAFEGNHSLTTPLQEGQETSIKPYIMPVAAVLKLVNNSAVAYRLDIMNLYPDIPVIEPNKTYIYHSWIGDYFIRSYPVNSTNLYSSFHYTLLCGDTAVINFP